MSRILCFCISLFLLGLQGCYFPQETEKQIAYSQLEGAWYLNQPGLYHTIYFQDSTHLALDTHIDTIFFFSYQIHSDTLFLYGEYETFINYNIIQKLTRDSLIFENLLDKEGIQRYAREKQE